MYHSITFGTGEVNNQKEFVGTNTWNEWHLLPSSRPTMAAPPVKNQSFIDIPGHPGSIDLSDYLTPNPVYGDRSGTFEFYVENDHEEWIGLYQKILDFLHGKRMKMVLADDDPYFYYEGRFNVEGWESGPNFSSVKINYRVGPYKHSLISPTEEIWDTFNFESGMDWGALYNVALTGGGVTYHMTGYTMLSELKMTLLSGSWGEVSLGSNTQSLSVGQTVTLTSPNNWDHTLTIKGNGRARILFTYGLL